MAPDGWTMTKVLTVAVAVLGIVGCSSESGTTTEPETIPTSSTEAERSDPTTLALFSRDVRDPAPPAEPTPIHAVGSIDTLPSDLVTWGDTSTIFLDDLATVGALGCAPGSEQCDVAGLAALQAAGVDVINVATRAFSQADASDLETFLDAAQEVQLKVIGLQLEEDSELNPVIVSREGAQVALIAIDLTNSTPVDLWPQTTTTTQFDAVVEGIARTASQEIPTVVFVDWASVGDRAATTPQIEAATLLLDAGAAAVIGQGPALLQRFEMKDGNVIAYNLGRASSTGAGTEVDAAVVRLDFSAVSASCLLPATASESGPVLAEIDIDAPCA